MRRILAQPSERTQQFFQTLLSSQIIRSFSSLFSRTAILPYPLRTLKRGKTVETVVTVDLLTSLEIMIKFSGTSSQGVVDLGIVATEKDR